MMMISLNKNDVKTWAVHHGRSFFVAGVFLWLCRRQHHASEK